MTLQPNWVSPPGDSIIRLMTVREIEADELAGALEIEEEEFECLLSGEIRINPEFAEVLSDYLGSTPRFWLARDQKFVAERKRIRAGKVDATEWANRMPLRSMRDFGWLPREGKKSRLQSDLLEYFGCKSLIDWKSRYESGFEFVAFRSSSAFESSDMATLVWRRAGERQAERFDFCKYDRDGFEEILPRLKKLAAFKHPRAIVRRLQEQCLRVGVGVTTARLPRGCRASGATWWSDSGNPIIHLSFRHLSDDHFWFTFYHEAGHVLLHGGEHVDKDLQGNRARNIDAMEREADQFASDTLIPSDVREKIFNSRPTARNVISLARVTGVAAGVVVGQLEKFHVIPYGRFSFLKHRYRWSEDPILPLLK